MSLKYRTLPEQRRAMLWQALQQQKKLRIMEAHNGLSGLIANSARITQGNGQVREFDGLWVSSLTDSAAKGHPDTEVVSFDSRLNTIQEIIQVTNKFIVVDGDTGGEASQFEYFCAKLENAGVSAVIIEDKQYPKRNSLAADAIQDLEIPEVFAEKISRGKSVCLSKEFLIFARIETFISGGNLKDAVERAKIYLEAGADGIVIHSSKNTPAQVYEFAHEYDSLFKFPANRKPLICIPTAYAETTDEELFQNNFDLIIYANYQLRAAHKAMQNVCLSILKNHCAFPSLSHISSVKEIFQQVGFEVVQQKDEQYHEHKMPVVLLGAGLPAQEIMEKFSKTPVSHLPINEKKLIDHQLFSIRNAGFKNTILVTGYANKGIDESEIEIIHNADYETSTAAYSLELAKDKIKNGCIAIFGDIAFDNKLLNKVYNAKGDIIVVIDHTRNMLSKQSIKPSIDLVVANKEHVTTIRHFNRGLVQISALGHGNLIKKATHEFIGVTKFSREGIHIFFSVLHELQKKKVSSNNENAKIDMVDVLEAIIERGHHVNGLEVTSGWLEIHSPEDLTAAEYLLK